MFEQIKAGKGKEKGYVHVSKHRLLSPQSPIKN